MELPNTVLIREVDAKASDYCLYADGWTTFADLYQGGVVIKDKVIKRAQYLLKKPKELAEVFIVRQQRFSYTNLLGNIVGWYAAALFKTPAQIVNKLAGASGDAALLIPKTIADFCAAFEKDCDHAGTAYVDFWRKVFESLILHKTAYVLIDLPNVAEGAAPPINLAQQQSAGLLDPYLVAYTPSQIINWETDRYGNLTWCIIAVSEEKREPLKKPTIVDYWYYFDSLQVACYSAERKENEARTEATDATSRATMCPGYPRAHSMTNLNRIPIRKIEVPDGLWLANRVWLPLLNHLNLDNAYDFALFQSALAQLVVEGEYDDDLTLSEVSYINVKQGCKVSFLEPEGKAYTAISNRLQDLEERIYKACYLMDQARTNRSTPSAQSGISKQQDKTPSRDALSGLGDVLRPAMQLVYQDVLAIRDMKQVTPDVRGFDYTDKAGVEDMDVLEKSTIIDIQSDTFKHERDMKMTRLVLPDLNPETQTRIDEEIRENPTPEAAAAAQQEQLAAKQLQSYDSTFKLGEQVGA